MNLPLPAASGFPGAQARRSSGQSRGSPLFNQRPAAPEPPQGDARHHPARRGFTFIEVIACLLVLTTGMLGATALVLSGLARAGEAQAEATALGTAMTVAVDADPLRVADGDWTAAGGVSSGYVNTYFVRRTETDGGTRLNNDDDGVTADDRIPNGFATRLVRVDVYDASGGKLLASFSQRLIRVHRE